LLAGVTDHPVGAHDGLQPRIASPILDVQGVPALVVGLADRCRVGVSDRVESVQRDQHSLSSVGPVGAVWLGDDQPAAELGVDRAEYRDGVSVCQQIALDGYEH
jgi:hypothetical protein